MTVPILHDAKVAVNAQKAARSAPDVHDVHDSRRCIIETDAPTSAGAARQRP